MKSPVVKYLELYAEKEARLACDFLVGDWLSIVTVPLTLEAEDFLPLLRSLDAAAGEKVLCVLTVNGKAGAAEENRKTLEALSPWITRRSDAMAFGSYSDRLDLLAVDRATRDFFGDKDGVGLARKIGADIALALISRGLVTNPWIFCTDGDATVSPDYFDIDETGISAALSPFQHLANDSRLDLYDLSLRYYVLGLHQAGSPYAFFTIGSTIAIEAEAYAIVRGFPKREAAEDFYLLNKLAKVAPIFQRTNGKVTLRDRPSARVPFGTGAAVARLVPESFSLYDPESFDVLGHWLTYADSVLRDPDFIGELPVRELVEKNGWSEMLAQACRNRKDADERRREFHRTFDGFQTLKFIHSVRDNGRPKLPWREALSKCSWLPSREFEGAVDECRERFEGWTEALQAERLMG